MSNRIVCVCLCTTDVHNIHRKQMWRINKHQFHIRFSINCLHETFDRFAGKLRIDWMWFSTSVDVFTMNSIQFSNYCYWRMFSTFQYFLESQTSSRTFDRSDSSEIFCKFSENNSICNICTWTCTYLQSSWAFPGNTSSKLLLLNHRWLVHVTRRLMNEHTRATAKVEMLDAADSFEENIVFFQWRFSHSFENT